MLKEDELQKISKGLEIAIKNNFSIPVNVEIKNDTSFVPKTLQTRVVLGRNNEYVLVFIDDTLQEIETQNLKDLDLEKTKDFIQVSDVLSKIIEFIPSYLINNKYIDDSLTRLSKDLQKIDKSIKIWKDEIWGEDLESINIYIIKICLSINVITDRNFKFISVRNSDSIDEAEPNSIHIDTSYDFEWEPAIAKLSQVLNLLAEYNKKYGCNN